MAKSQNFVTTLHLKTQMDLGDTLKNVKQLQTALGNIGNGKGGTTKQYQAITNSITDIELKYANLQKRFKQGFSNETELKQYIKDCDSISNEFQKIYYNANQLNNSLKHTFDPALIADEEKKLQQLNQAYKEFKNSLNAQIGNSIETAFDGTLEKIDKASIKEKNYLDLIKKEAEYRSKANAQQTEADKKSYGQDAAKDLKKNVNNSRTIEGSISMAQRQSSARTGVKNTNVETALFTDDVSKRQITNTIRDAIISKVDETIGSGQKLSMEDIKKTILERFTSQGWDFNGEEGKNIFDDFFNNFRAQSEDFNDNLIAINALLDTIQQEYQQTEQQIQTQAENAQENAKAIIDNSQSTKDGYEGKIENQREVVSHYKNDNNGEEQDRLNQTIGKVSTEDYEKLLKTIQQIKNETGNTVPVVKEFGDQFSRVKGWIQNFVSLQSAIEGIKTVVRNAYETVKQLDESFASIAMVTDYDVSDLWGQYDEYAQMATKLGVSTNDAIQSSALFYQQGMDTNEALKSTVNTLTLARLANEDFSTATEQMTAAMQAYDMTADESIHVTDAWSELAAKTAADVGDIATAFSKVGSLAQDAGMDFDTLSAYLAETKEVTQEAPKQQKFRLMYA